MNDAKNVTMNDVELEKAEIEAAMSEDAQDKEESTPEEANAPEEEKKAPAKEEKKTQKKEEKKAPAKEEKKVQGSPYPAGYGEMMTICVPKDKLNPNDDIIPVHINEFSWKIVRGEPTKVPKAVYDVLHAGEYL